jgi:hypothetical protein
MIALIESRAAKLGFDLVFCPSSLCSGSLELCDRMGRANDIFAKANLKIILLGESCIATSPLQRALTLILLDFERLDTIYIIPPFGCEKS